MVRAKPLGEYVTFHIADPQPLNAFDRMIGSQMAEAKIASNWYGSFSSGRAGFVGYWHFDNKDPSKPWRRLNELFMSADSTGRLWVYKYPQLQINRANGNCGSCNVVFDASDENIAFVIRLLTQAGYTIRHENRS